MKRVFLPILAMTLFAVAAPVRAETSNNTETTVKAVAPFIEAETVAVVHIDMVRLNSSLDAALDLLGRFFSPMDFEEVRKEIGPNVNEFIRLGGKNVYLIISLSPQEILPRLTGVVPLPPGTDEKAALKSLGAAPQTPHKMIGGFLVTQGFSKKTNWEFLPAERPELKMALEAAGDAAIQAVLIPPASARRVVEELVPPLPKEIGGGSSTILTHGVSWAAASLDFSPEKTFRLTIQSQDVSAAEALQKTIAQALDFAMTMPVVRETLPKIDEIVPLITPKVEGDCLSLVLDKKQNGFEKVLAAASPTLDRLQQADARRESANNLKQLGLAMHTYYDVNKHFPAPASKSADGKPLLSWRVYVLPFLENNDLYKKFHLDEPWDSPHNKTLVDKMPKEFRSPFSKNKELGKTNYLVPVGNGAFFDADKPTTLKEIQDGTSHTIMAVEVDDDHAVVWTKPDDWQFDPQRPKLGLGHLYGDGKFFLTLFGDGSVRTIKSEVIPETLKAAFTRDAGDAVNANGFD